MNTKMNYPVAALLMAATAEAQQQVPEQWRPFIMIAVLLIGYSLHIFNGHDDSRPRKEPPANGNNDRHTS